MARRRPPRPLRPDEADLWQQVARTTRALRPEKPVASSQPAFVPEPTPAPPAAAVPDVPGLVPFRIGALRSTTAAPTQLPSDRLSESIRIGSKTHRRMARGKLAPEARLDLHGLTLSEAQAAVARFVTASHAAGRRLVLVITGKGRAGIHADGIHRQTGALRREVPLWLARPPLAALVQQVSEAHARHGGAGALYVYLRRRD